MVNHKLQSETDTSIMDTVTQGLANVEHGLSQEAIRFSCSYNNIRKDGDYFAHSASEEKIKDAVETKSVDSQERHFLEQIYNFVFNGYLQSDPPKKNLDSHFWHGNIPYIRLDLSS